MPSTSIEDLSFDLSGSHFSFSIVHHANLDIVVQLYMLLEYKVTF